jgi:predicted nucleic acid-binding protein
MYLIDTNVVSQARRDAKKPWRRRLVQKFG